jgi:hypothetical protein
LGEHRSTWLLDGLATLSACVALQRATDRPDVSPVHRP